MSILAAMIIVACAWAIAGTLFAFALSRRGHRFWPWFVLGLVFGPITPFLAADALGAWHSTADTTLREPAPDGGPSVLVGVDGSQASEEALAWVHRVLAPLGAQITLATAIDYESAANPTAFDDRAAAEAHLAELADSLEARAGIAVLSGEPGAALRRYAADHGIDLVVIGRAGKFSRIVGSTSKHLVEGEPIAILLDA
jgi:nucleotide-binding universal stress UspA family protein